MIETKVLKTKSTTFPPSFCTSTVPARASEGRQSFKDKIYNVQVVTHQRPPRYSLLPDSLSSTKGGPIIQWDLNNPPNPPPDGDVSKCVSDEYGESKRKKKLSDGIGTSW